MVVAATGFFDGVHLGHRKVLEQLCLIAQAEGKKSAVITFWPHPRTVLQQDAFSLRLLTSLDEKKKLLLSMGIDEVYVINFSKEFSSLSTAEFIKEYLVGKYDVSTLIIGYDHRLGHTSESKSDDIIDIASRLGVKAVRVGEYRPSENEKPVSSTSIRNALINGEIRQANEMLGYSYGLYGVVVVGSRLGRKFGFPTANLQLYEPLKLVPQIGVYAVWVEVNGKTYKGVCNIGIRPTIGDGRGMTIETHILDFNEDIYGLNLKIEFIDRIRDEVKFDSTLSLRRQLALDKQRADDILNMPVPHSLR